jgi:hypothetical protein
MDWLIAPFAAYALILLVFGGFVRSDREAALE